MVDRINPTELQLNTANSPDTELPFLDLCISNGTVFIKKSNDKRDDFDFDIVNFPFLDGVHIRAIHIKKLLQQGISEPEFYGEIVGKSNFSEQFRKLINSFKRFSYSLDIMRQLACIVFIPIIVDG